MVSMPIVRSAGRRNIQDRESNSSAATNAGPEEVAARKGQIVCVSVATVVAWMGVCE